MSLRDLRLKKAAFDVAYQNGRQLRHPLLGCRYYLRPAADGSGVRAAFVAPRRLGKATVRNLWKRRMRHWFYEILREALISHSEETKSEGISAWQRCDFIFILTAQGKEAPPREVWQAMKTLWHRARRSLARSECAQH